MKHAEFITASPMIFPLTINTDMRYNASVNAAHKIVVLILLFSIFAFMKLPIPPAIVNATALRKPYFDGA